MKNFFFALLFTMAIASPSIAAVNAPQSQETIKQESAFWRVNCTWVNGIPVCRFVS